MKNIDKKSLIYLACPYSDKDRSVRISRFKAANRAAGKLMNKGLYVFSPISHTHPIAEECKLPIGWEYWQGYDRKCLSNCKKMIILKLPGWKNSKGVAGEIEIAKELGIEIGYMEPV